MTALKMWRFPSTSIGEELSPATGPGVFRMLRVGHVVR